MFRFRQNRGLRNWNNVCFFLLIFSVIFLYVPPVDAGHPDENSPFRLTEEERGWFSAHPVITIAPDPYFPPIEYFDKDGNYTGIAADYIAILEEKLGIKFKVVHCKSWNEALEKARTKEVDVLPAAAQSSERSKYLLFCDPHIVLPGVIIVRKDVKETIGMEKLCDLKVSVVKSYVWQEFIQTDYPDINLDLVPDLQTGLRNVSLGASDAVVATLPVAIYYIKKEGITNLRVAGETGYFTRLSFASRNDWPQFNSIIKRALTRVSPNEKNAILSKWIHLGQKSFFKSSEFLGILFISFLQVVFILMLILIWKYHQKKFLQLYPEDKADSVNIVFLVTAMFILLGVVVCLDEFLDIPNLILGVPKTPINYWEVLLETVLIYLLGGVSVFLLIRSINTRRRNEEALRQSEERYSLIAENVADVIWTMDMDLRFTYVSPASYKLIGYTSEELMAMTLDRILPPAFLNLVYSAFEKEKARKASGQADSNRIHTFEVEHICKDGSVIWVEMKMSGIRDRNGRWTGVLGVTRDITDRRHAEDALRESETRFRELFENMRSGVAVYEAVDDGEDFIFKDFNKGGEEIEGLSKEAVAGRRVTEVFPGVKESGIFDKFKKVWRTGTPECFTDVMYKDERISGWRDNNIYKLSSGEVVAIFEDITEKKRLEAQFLQAQKMEAVGTLAGGIAHDFNNMIQAMLGYTQILMMGKKPDDSDYSKLKAIEKVACRAGDLTKQILLFSRKGEINLRPVELNLEVRSVCKLLERSIPKMISIELHLAERLKIINADPAQLEQIMMNLGVNARDAMPDGGNLIFETENVILDEEYCKTHLEATTGEYVMLSVSDTGNGMEKEIAEHIFEPFYTTKETGKGTGLGLSTVYGIVKRHGGNVNCYSESGHGATFKIYFPVIEQERAVAEEKEVQVPVSGGNETILLVDDEESIRELGEDILVRFGYTVVTASDGESALEIYRRKEQKIDLVVLDLIMPGMGGRRCLEEILKIDSEATVIIASGYSANGKVKEALESGAVEFIGKPYNIKDMLRKVRNVLDK